MERICPVEHCTGCMACYNSCCHQAIVVTEDSCGFRYPVIDGEKCVNCGLCASVCPVNIPVESRHPFTVYAAYSHDNKDRMSSASGGASSVLAKRMIREGGIVYGCEQRSYEIIEHVRIEEAKDLYRIKGSKYVQSNIGEIFRQVKKDLSGGKQVLFTGTPCQVAGVRSFLRKDYPGLVTVDLVCHGVPSGRLLQDDIREIVKKKKLPKKTYKVYFRIKGERERDLKFGIFLHDTVGDSARDLVAAIEYPYDYYIAGFMNGLFFRESCYSCRYANSKRVSDITICDYWGIGKTSLDTGKGISALLLNTEKGIHFFECCKDGFVCEERLVEEAIRGNGQLQHPSVKNKNYELFRKLYSSRGFAGSVRRCLFSFYMHYYGIEMIKSKLVHIPLIYRFCKVLKKTFKY